MNNIEEDFFQNLRPTESWDLFANSMFNLLGLDFTYETLSDVTVLGDLCIVDAQTNRPVLNSLNEFLYWQPKTFSPDVFSNEDQKIIVIKERLAMLDALIRQFLSVPNLDLVHIEDEIEYIYIAHTFGWYPYGHLHDSLQRLFTLKDGLIKGKCKFVISNYSRVESFFDHLSVAAGFDVSSEDVLLLEKFKKYKFKNLKIANSPALITNFTSESYAWLVRSYLKRFLKSSLQRIPGIYLSRNHVSPGARGVINEDDVVKYLTDRNFIIVNGTESLQDIINLFYCAEMVIGAHGSLFANTIFCQPNCVIYEYCPDNRVDYSFERKFKACQNYNHLLLAADDKFNISIPYSEISLIKNT